MKCNVCENYIEENAKFCSSCGARVEFVEREKTEIQIGEDVLIIHDLEIAVPIYQKVAEYTDEIERLNKERTHRKHWIISLYVHFYIWMGVFAFFFGLAAIISQLLPELEMIFVNGALIGTVVGIYLVERWRTVKKNEKYDTQIANIEDALNRYIQENTCEELHCIPEKYRYYIAASYILECLKYGRASNLKEAINLYEDQLHKWKMEGYQQQILNTAQQQLEVSNAILRKW